MQRHYGVHVIESVQEIDVGELRRSSLEQQIAGVSASMRGLGEQFQAYLSGMVG